MLKLLAIEVLQEEEEEEEEERNTKKTIPRRRKRQGNRIFQNAKKVIQAPIEHFVFCRQNGNWWYMTLIVSPLIWEQIIFTKF